MTASGATPGSGGLSPTATGSMWDPIAARLGDALIGEFELLGKLGEGGMAAVFLAHEFALNRKVALKVMSPALMMGEGMVDRFRQEAVTQANLQHANIVGVHGVRNVDELHFFVMQYVMGRTVQDSLRAELAAGRLLHIAVVQALVFQVGSALAYAHRRGVIHRDVKPGNILLNSDGDAVVTDFGIAKVAEAPSQTMTGTVVGTPAYMSPEQCFASQLTPASDQYSLGVVAYELLTGRTPFQGTSFVLMQAHTTKTPPPISEARSDCPPEVTAAVLRMLAKEPDERFSDMAEALHAMGAHAPGVRSDDPLRRELRRLADVEGIERSLGDILNAPQSPIPQSKRSGRVTGAPSAPTPSPETSAGSGAGTPAETQPDPSAAPAASPNAIPSALRPPLAASSPQPLSATAVLAGEAFDAAAAEGAPRRTVPLHATVREAGAAATVVSPWRRPMLVLAGVLTVVAAAVGIWALLRPPSIASSDAPAPTEAPAIGAAEPDSFSSPTDSPAPSPASRRLAIISPATGELESGGQLALRAESDPANEAPLTWRSSSGRIASVNSRTGVVDARTAGVVTVTVTQGVQRDSVQLTVVDRDRTAAASEPKPAPADIASPTTTTEAPPSTSSRPITAPAIPPPPPRTVESPPPTDAGTTPVTPAKSDAELRAEAEGAVAAYASAIGSRDTTRVRRAFPAASAQLLRQWQGMFESTESVRVTVDAVVPLDKMDVAVGATSRFQVKQTVSFTVAGSRRAQVQKAEYMATLRREGAGWSLVGISDQ